MIAEAQAALDRLMEGNRRFREGRSEHRIYSHEELSELAKAQKPIAAVVACADSRVAPDIVFDQPLGSIFASRVPGNVASDSAKWMLEIAVQEFRVPLVLVLGHTGCLAVGQLLEGDKGGPGGQLRSVVLSAVYEARSRKPTDLYSEAIVVNALQTVDHLKRDSYAVRRAIEEQRIELVAAVYDMHSGEVRLLED